MQFIAIVLLFLLHSRPATDPAQPEDGLALEFASLELQKDEGIALEAVKSNTARHPEKIQGEKQVIKQHQ